MSDLDQAAIDFNNALRRCAELHTVRTRVTAGVGRRRWRPIVFTVDACRLERWLMKLAFGAAPTFRAQIGNWHPSAEQAALALGTRPISESLGMHAIARAGESFASTERMTFSYGRRFDGGDPVAISTALQGGYQLACAWEPARTSNDRILFDGAREPARLIHRPPSYEFRIDDRHAGLSIRFDWSGRWSARRYPDVAALRARYPAPPR